MRAQPVAGILAATACLLCEASAGQDHSSTLGLFDDQSDIGSVLPPGTGRYDPGKGTFEITLSFKSTLPAAPQEPAAAGAVSGEGEKAP